MEPLTVFRSHTPRLIRDDTCRLSAVCLPFIEERDGLHILFELRSGTMSENAGDICFPGGMVEPGEEPLTAALRELKEELLLEDADIEYLGAGDIFHNFSVEVHSYAVLLKHYEGTFCRDEVKEVFTVPLQQLLACTPETGLMEWRAVTPEDFPYAHISGGRAHKFRPQRYRQYFYPSPYGRIWGITGKLLHACLDMIKEGSEPMPDRPQA